MSKKEYLKEYEVLCRKYNLYVTSCGCCPDGIESVDDEDEITKHIQELNG